MRKEKDLIILGIETSCDDTAISVLKYSENSISILSNIRQTHLSKEYDGIVPEIVARNHLKYIKSLIKEALKIADQKEENLDIISSTVGPGLIGSLIVGYNYGATLAFKYKKIFIPIHHIEGHIAASHIQQKINYPYLAMIISGGHTLIIQVNNFFDYKILASTIDDAIGELFDKIGRKIGLSYPAGPEIEILAKQYTNNIDVYEKFPLISIPIRDRFDFSFSGLKTQFLKLSDIYPKEQIAYEIQNSCSRILKFKLEMAIKKTNIKNIIIAGGVAANLHIRNTLSSLNVFYPSPNLCVDNGAMIAAAGLMHYLNNTKMVNNLNIEEFAKKNIEEWCK